MGEVIEIIKKCAGSCGQEKIENKDNFYFRKDNNKYRNACKICCDARVVERLSKKPKIIKIKKTKSVGHKQNVNDKREDIIEDGVIKRYCRKCPNLKALDENNFQFVKKSQSFRHVCKVCEHERKTKYYHDNKTEPEIKPIIVQIKKICTGPCGEEKLINDDNFYFKTDINKYNDKCRICVSLQRAEHHENNKEEINKRANKHYHENKEQISINNKLKRASRTEEEKEKDRQSKRQYAQSHKKEIAAAQKEYRKKTQNKLRHSVSSAILYYFSERGKKKTGSITKYLPYKMAELEKHIEKIFKEPGNEWMTWENWGVYDPKTWDDNDKSTWVWHLDHIKPQSWFTYESMEDEEFKECWALNNLRPYSAKLNVIEKDRK